MGKGKRREGEMRVGKGNESEGRGVEEEERK